MPTPRQRRTTRRKWKTPPHTAVVTAKTVLDKARSLGEEAGAKAKVIGTQIFQLYVILLSDESHQLWDNIVKALTEIAPWEDLKGEVHDEKKDKDLGSISPLHDLTLVDHLPA